VGIICGGAGKLCISTDVEDSVDLRFLKRVGAMSLTTVVIVVVVFFLEAI